MLSKVRANIQERNLIAPGQTVIVAVSGGADSVALLHVLSRLRRCLRFHVHVASLDHGIRGEAATQDVQLVRELASRWDLPFTAGSANALAFAKNEGIGLEDAARRVRYDFLATVAMRQDSACVAVGHHALDQVETILMHIIRGAGTKGLRGMSMFSPMPCHKDLMLARPLLNISRNDIEAYCAANHLEFHHDISNDDTRHLRNFLRHRIVMPLLKRRPHLVESFQRLAAAAESDHNYIETRFKHDVLPLVEKREDCWRISQADFQSCHVVMQSRLLREAFRSLGASNYDLSFDATREALDWIGDAAVGKSRDLGMGIRLRIGYDSLRIERRTAEQHFEDYRLIASDTQIRLATPEEFTIGQVTIALVQGEAKESCSLCIRVPAGAELLLRTRRKGERFRPRGMAGKSRKIKDWMIDRKIPRQIRDQIPVVSLDREVIAICVGDTWHLADMPRETIGSGQFNTLILN